MKINKDIEEFSIQELFQNDQYKVPLYQRNYAWGEEECIQLVQDVCDYAKNGGRNNYYIGTLVTFPREEGEKFIMRSLMDSNGSQPSLSYYAF